MPSVQKKRAAKKPAKPAASSRPPGPSQLVIGSTGDVWTFVETFDQNPGPFIYVTDGKESDRVVMLDVEERKIYTGGADWADIGRAVGEATSLSETGYTIEGQSFPSVTLPDPKPANVGEWKFEPLFIAYAGKPMPFFPPGAGTGEVVANGVDVFNAVQASKRFGVPEQTLRDDFDSHFGFMFRGGLAAGNGGAAMATNVVNPATPAVPPSEEGVQ